MDALPITRALIVLEAARVRARQINNPGFPGRNFMTPRLVGYYSIRGRKVELSEGEFMGDPMVGVTIMDDHDASAACFSLDDLRAKLEAL